MVRTRFIVDRVIRQVRSPAEIEVQTVVLKPLRGGGEIQLDTTQSEAADQFTLGHIYHVDFSRAD